MKTKSIILTGFLFFLFFTPLRGEFYQYVDKNGVKHFTDNAAEIPENQRNTSNVHQSIQPPEPEDEEEEVSADQDDGVTVESLTIQRAELDQEYNRLLEKKQTLEGQKKDIAEDEYNKLVNALNQDIRQYHLRNQRYQDLVNEYNNQVSLKKQAAARPDSKDTDAEQTRPRGDYEAPEEQ